jgi:hypothetical protein
MFKQGGFGVLFFFALLLLSFGVFSRDNNENYISINRDVVEYCSHKGCDNAMFYRYYKKNLPRFCSESDSILSQKKHTSVLKFLLKESILFNLPVTVSVLPIIESSLNPNAAASTHHNSAKGLWQLKPGTARDMGLKVGGGVDDRMDIRKSTMGGLRYMVWLHNRFDDDHNLSVLAYNVGVGRVERMIKKYNTKNAWYLSRLISRKNDENDYLLKYYAYSLSLMRKGC